METDYFNQSEVLTNQEEESGKAITGEPNW